MLAALCKDAVSWRSMIEIFSTAKEELFDEIVEKGKENMVITEEAYHMLVEEVIGDAVADGRLNVDQDTEGMEAHFKQRWPEYMDTLDIET